MASISINGDTSGSITVTAPTVAGTNTLTLPAATDTLVGKATTDTLTNKTLSTNCVLGTSLIVSRTAQASTSGTSIDFTSIPSWVKIITVMLNGVSTNGTVNWLVQVGSGSVSTSGYTGIGTVMGGSTVTTTSTASGFPIIQNNAGFTIYGNIIITNITGNSWLCSGIVGTAAAAVNTFITSGGIALSGTLDRLRITTANGTDSFDAGSINIMYE